MERWHLAWNQEPHTTSLTQHKVGRDGFFLLAWAKVLFQHLQPSIGHFRLQFATMRLWVILTDPGRCPQVCFVACVCPNRSGGCCCYGWWILFTLTILNSVPSGACHCFDGGSCGEVTRLKITNMYGIVFVVPVGSKGETPKNDNEKSAVPGNLNINFQMLLWLPPFLENNNNQQVRIKSSSATIAAIAR